MSTNHADEYQELVHGERQCECCGDWLPVTGTTERPCACGLVKDDHAETDQLALKVAYLFDAHVIGGMTVEQAAIVRHNMASLASIAEQVAINVDQSLAQR